MKQSVRGTTGRIADHGHGVGVMSNQDLERRAREIAETNGRRPEDYNEADLEQARNELLGNMASEPAEGEEVRKISEWMTEPATQAPTRSPNDEQTVGERLVEEGVEEAAHDQMVQGNRRSREADQI